MQLYRRANAGQGYYKLFSSSKLLYSFLRANLNPKKLMELLKTDSLQTAFWRGFFDAEGHLGYSKYNGTPQAVSISNTNRELIEWGRQVLLDRGYQVKLYEHRHKEDGCKRKLAFSLQLTTQADTKQFLTEFSPAVAHLASKDYKEITVEAE